MEKLLEMCIRDSSNPAVQHHLYAHLFLRKPYDMSQDVYKRQQLH